MNTKIKPLTAEMAHDVFAIIEAHPCEPVARPRSKPLECRDALIALRDGHHVTVEKLTEAEALAQWDRAHPMNTNRSDSITLANRIGWVAALRDAGLVKP